MIERVQFGVLVDNRITSTHRSHATAQALVDATGEGDVVVRTVVFGTWGPPGPLCPAHSLSYCHECGWTWRT